MEKAKKRVDDPTASYSLSRKVLCVVLSAVLFGFGWPAINPIEVLAADNAAAGESKPAASESAAQSGAASADAAAGAASGTRAQADSAADQKAAATDAAASSAAGSASAGEQQAAAQGDASATQAAASQQATATEQGTVVIGLKFANASILPDGDTETVGAPATKLTVPQNDYKFTVVPDEGYKVDKVIYNGKDLSAGANGVYVIGATDLADGATLSVSAVADEAKETKPVESTPIEKTDDGSNEVAADDAAPFAAADAKAASAGYTVEAGKSINVSGTWGDSHKWSIESGNDYASISNTNGQTVVVSGKSAGSVELKHWYSHKNYGHGPNETWDFETFTVEVTAPAPVTEITISGADSVKQFESIALSSNVTSNVVWSSSDESIAKVDGSGKVTGVNVGEATVYATTTGADGSQLKAEHKVAVTANVSSAVACVFFVKSAAISPESNSASDWYPQGGGDNTNITANINVAGLERQQGNANWDKIDGKNFNLLTNVAGRFISWNANDYIDADGKLKPNTYYWNVAFDAFKSQIGDKATADDVKSIKLVPYKISYYNDGNQSRKFHLDCTVVVEAKNAFTATYYVWDAGAKSFEWFDAATYKTDGAMVTVSGSSKDNEKNLPATKVVNGKTYKLFKWYTNEALSSNVVTFPTQIYENANYYAKYLSVSNTCTVNYLVKDADGNVVKDANGNAVQAKPSEIRNNLTAGQMVTETAPSIDGYTHVASDEATKSITVSDAEDNVINFYYTQDNYSYTINYVWNNTADGDAGHVVKRPETAMAKSGDKVSLTDDQLAVDGYTIVPGQSTEYTIDANNKVIEVKYYKNVDLTAKSDEGLIYKGQAQTVSGYTGAPEGVTFEGVTASGTQTNAGEYKDEVKFAKESGEVVGTVDSSAKYIVKSATPGSMKISQAELVVKASPAEKTYGEADPAFTAEVTGLVGDDKDKADLIKYEVSRTNDAEAVGTYPGVIVPSGAEVQGNYKVTYQPADFAIKAKAIDFTVDTLKDVIYNGEDQKQEPVVKDGDKVLTEGVDYELSYSSDVKNVGTVTVIVAGRGNYVGSKGEVSYKITQAPVTVTAEDASKYYGDADPAFTAKVGGLVEADKDKAAELIKYEVKREGSDEAVGTYPDVIVPSGEASQGNYSVTYVSAKFIINKKEAGSYSASVSIEGWTYNGKFDAEGSLKSEASSEADGAKATYEYYRGTTKLDAAPVDAGTYTVVATWPATANYPELQAKADFTIAPAPYHFKTGSDKKSYDGAVLEGGKVEVVGMVEGESVEATSTTIGPDVSKATNDVTNIEWTNAKESNYTHEADELGELEINKAAVTSLTATVSISGWTYDGKFDVAQTLESKADTEKFGAKVTYSYEKVDGTKLDSEPVNVGDYKVIANWEGTNNYPALTATATFTISPASVTVTAVAASKTYGDADPTDLSATVGKLVGNDDASLIEYSVALGEHAEGAGTYTGAVVASGAEVQGNYKVTYVPADFTINKAKYHFETATGSKGYDGNTLVGTAEVIGLVKGEKATVAGSTIGPDVTAETTNAVTGEVAWSEGVNADNYEHDAAADKLGTLEIYKKAADAYNASVDIKDWTYDGQFDAAKKLTSKSDTAEGAGTYTYFDANGNQLASEPTDAGTYKVVASWPETKNYPAMSAEKEFTIAKRAIELTAASAEKTFDGSALTKNAPTDFTVSKGSFVDGQGVTVVIIGSQTNVGESQNVIDTNSVTGNDKTNLDNYAITCVPGILKVTDNNVDPSKVITKTHQGGTYKSGDVVTFTLSAKNIYSEKKTLTFTEQDGVTITGQSVFENVGPGETVSTTATYTITDADVIAGVFNNTATVSFSGGKSFDGKDSVTTPELNTTLKLEKKAKSSDNGSSYKLGETVKYTITVTNTGNITYTNVVVKDDQTGLNETIASLAPGESQDLSTTHVVTESDIVAGKYENTATAKADTITDKDGKDVTPKAEDTETIGSGTKTIEPMRASLNVVKTSDVAKDTLLKEGDTVNYTVVVTNTGNVTISKVAVTDSLDAATQTSGPGDSISLAPGAEATYTYVYTVTQQDVVAGHVQNIATATGTDPKGGEVLKSGVVDDPTVKAAPSLHIKKVADITKDAKAGDVITYTITVTNNGNIDLQNVVVTDDLTGLTGDNAHKIGDLAKGASTTFETTYTVTEDDVVAGGVTNVATGSADNKGGKPTEVIPGEATTDTEAVSPSISVEKVADNGVYGAGDEIHYTITVTNTGNVKLSGVNVVDEKTGLNETVDIAAGALQKFDTTYAVTEDDIDAGEVVNVATAKGTDPKGTEVSGEATETVTNEPQTDPTNPDKPSLKRHFTVDQLADVPYNGAEQAQKPGVRELVEGVDYDLAFSEDATNVGTVTVIVTGKGNYAGTIERTYRILPATLVIATGSAEKTFDGDALTNGKVSVEHRDKNGNLVPGLLGSDRVSIRVTGTQTEVGSSENGYSINWLETNANNYVIVEQLGVLTVNPAPAPAPVTPDTPATPTTPTAPTTPNAPAATPADGTPAGPVAAVAQGLQGAYEAVTGDVAPANEEQIFDEENPLGKAATPSCWVHFYMIILMIITAVYGVLVVLRRSNHTRRLKDDMDNMLDGGSKAPNAPAATSKPVMEA